MNLRNLLRCFASGGDDSTPYKTPLATSVNKFELTEDAKKQLVDNNLRSIEIRLNILENEANVIVRRV